MDYHNNNECTYSKIIKNYENSMKISSNIYPIVSILVEHEHCVFDFNNY